MSVLVIGRGSIGRRHAENLMVLGESALPLSFRDSGLDGVQGILETNDFRAAVIATDTQVRLPLIRLLADRNIPFYVEKPLAYDVQTLTEIYLAAAPVAERSMIGFMMRYHPAVRYLNRLALDDVYRFSLEIGYDVHQWRENWNFSTSYAARSDGGGVLLDLCHELDIASILFPDLEVRDVASIGHPDYSGVDFVSHVSLSARRAESVWSVMGTISMDYLSPVNFRRIVLRGTHGSYEFDFTANSYVFHDKDGPKDMALSIERNEMFLEAMRDFLAMVDGRVVRDNRLVPSLNQVAGSNNLICAAYEKRQFVTEFNI